MKGLPGDARADQFFGVQKIEIPEGVTEIKEEAFANTPIQIAVMPNDLCCIAEKTFCGCKKMAWVHLPAVLKSIGRSAFEGSSLYRIQLPDSLESIEGRAFGDCKCLKEAKLPNGIRNVDSTAFVGSSVGHLDYPDSVIMPEEIKDPGFSEQIARSQRELHDSRRYDSYIVGLDSEGAAVYDGIPDDENRRVRLCGYPPEISVPTHLADMRSQFPDEVEFIVRESETQEA